MREVLGNHGLGITSWSNLHDFSSLAPGQERFRVRLGELVCAEKVSQSNTSPDPVVLLSHGVGFDGSAEVRDGLEECAVVLDGKARRQAMVLYWVEVQDVGGESLVETLGILHGKFDGGYGADFADFLE